MTQQTYMVECKGRPDGDGIPHWSCSNPGGNATMFIYP